MIRFLTHSEIDPEKWNQTVRNSLSPTIFAAYELLDLLTGDDTWHALVEDDYETVMPLPTRKKGGLKYVYTPFFVRQMGIFSRKKMSSDDIEAFLAEVSRHYILADLLMNVNSTPASGAEPWYFAGDAPKVLEYTTSAPAAMYASCTARTSSGRVRFQSSGISPG